VLVAGSAAEVRPFFEEIEAAQADGRFVAGYLSYEAGAAFGLATRAPAGIAGMPLAYAAVYVPQDVTAVSHAQVREGGLLGGPLPRTPTPRGFRLSVTRREYGLAIARVRDLIAAGDTYQVNYTCHARFTVDVDPLRYFLTLALAHPVPYAAYLGLDETKHDVQMLSLSPELFLSRRGDLLESRPMKGTRPRGRTLEEDEAFKRELMESEKDRAENLMITDMVRNDVGRVCEIGSIRWPEVFSVERYRSVWQMTSTVTGTLPTGGKRPSLGDVMEAVFPAASITGAPKYHTMEIIREVEREPRGVYTGAVCLFLPGGDFTCNVAIRTLVHQRGAIDLGLGGGIVWDSRAGDEYEEARVKGRFLYNGVPDLRLFETLLLDGNGYAFEVKHLVRLGRSAEYWGFPFDRERARSELAAFATSVAGGSAEGALCGAGARRVPLVVRLELDTDGRLTIVPREVAPSPDGPVPVLVSRRRTDPGDRFLYHKTSRRELYDGERRRAAARGFYEVIFCNTKGHVTEGAITSIFARFGEQWVTPPVGDGLLPGIWRECYLRETDGSEASLTLADLRAADEVVIGSSVRGRVMVGRIEDYLSGASAKLG
jgi:para-aminobenzoate synthetase / 4-amino-4-deoxychorismate lyase